MASNFVGAAAIASKEVGCNGKMFLLKIKQPKANVINSRKTPNMNVVIDHL